MFQNLVNSIPQLVVISPRNGGVPADTGFRFFHEPPAAAYQAVSKKTPTSIGGEMNCEKNTAPF